MSSPRVFICKQSSWWIWYCWPFGLGFIWLQIPTLSLDLLTDSSLTDLGWWTVHWLIQVDGQVTDWPRLMDSSPGWLRLTDSSLTDLSWRIVHWPTKVDGQLSDWPTLMDSSLTDVGWQTAHWLTQVVVVAWWAVTGLIKLLSTLFALNHHRMYLITWGSSKMTLCR